MEENSNVLLKCYFLRHIQLPSNIKMLMLSQLKREHDGALKGTQGVAEADGSSCRFAGNTPETKVTMLLQCFFTVLLKVKAKHWMCSFMMEMSCDCRCNQFPKEDK